MYSDTKLNIVFLLDTLHSMNAGSEKQLCRLGLELFENGHNVEIILLRHSSFSQKKLRFPFNVRSLNIYKLKSFNALFKLIKFRFYLSKRPLTILHTCFPDSCLIAPIFLKTSNVKIVSSRRDMGLNYLIHPVWFYRIISPRVDFFIANSETVSEYAKSKENIHNNKCVVIKNGIDSFTNKGSSIPKIFKFNNSLKVIIVANVKRVKRILDAVKAINFCNKSKIPIELAVVGKVQEKDYYDHILSYIDKYNLHDQINFIGPHEEPRALLNQADVGLLVSDSEGLSNTIMEYMQAELPVVATNVGGNSELVDHQITGFLANVGNIFEISNALITLSKDNKLRVSMGSRGKVKISNEFQYSSVVEKHINIYQKIIGL